MKPRPGLDLDSLTGRIAALDEEGALAAVRTRVTAGDDAFAIIADCQRGVQLVGEDYASGEYFISGLIMAGEIFREAMEVLEPLLPAAADGTADEPASGREATALHDTSGTVLICTVRGDIHDIGKSIVVMLLRSYGYVVHDLGVDVAPDEVARRTRELRPDIVGLSGLLTQATAEMKATVQEVHAAAAEVGHPLPVIIGGGIVTEQTRAWTGADLWSRDASDGVRLIREAIAVAYGGR